MIHFGCLGFWCMIYSFAFDATAKNVYNLFKKNIKEKLKEGVNDYKKWRKRG